jgi:hypothetical protein
MTGEGLEKKSVDSTACENNGAPQKGPAVKRMGMSKKHRVYINSMVKSRVGKAAEGTMLAAPRCFACHDQREEAWRVQAARNTRTANNNTKHQPRSLDRTKISTTFIPQHR